VELELDDFFFFFSLSILLLAKEERMDIAGHWHCDNGTSDRTVQCSSYIASHQEPTARVILPSSAHRLRGERSGLFRISFLFEDSPHSQVLVLVSTRTHRKVNEKLI